MPSSNGIPNLVMLPSGSGWRMCSRRSSRFGRRGLGRSNLDTRGRLVSVLRRSRVSNDRVVLGSQQLAVVAVGH